MLKPVEEGSSLGVTKCGDAETLRPAIEQAARSTGAMFAERFVAGREITVGVLETRRPGARRCPSWNWCPRTSSTTTRPSTPKA